MWYLLLLIFPQPHLNLINLLGTHILAKLPALNRCMVTPTLTLENDPILHLTRPMIDILSSPPATGDISVLPATGNQKSTETPSTKPQYADVVKAFFIIPAKSESGKNKNHVAPLAQDDGSNLPPIDKSNEMEEIPMEEY